MREFGTYERELLHVRILSTAARARREKVLERHGAGGERLTVEHVEGDYVEPGDIEAAAPGDHDAVLLVGSDRLRGEEESDARTIMGSLGLHELGYPTAETQIIVELLDPDNVRLLEGAREEVIISPLIVSHLLAHVALRPELRAVFEELFTAGGAEITFEPLDVYAPQAEPGAELSFREVRRAAYERGEIALGVRTGPRAVDLALNPPDDRRLSAGAGLQVVTLVTYL
jgi:hypothetical protein